MAVVAQWYANERPGPGWIGHELGKRGISAHVRCNLIRGSANSTLAEVFSLPWRILLFYMTTEIRIVHGLVVLLRTQLGSAAGAG